MKKKNYQLKKALKSVGLVVVGGIITAGTIVLRSYLRTPAPGTKVEDLRYFDRTDNPKMEPWIAAMIVGKTRCRDLKHVDTSTLMLSDEAAVSLYKILGKTLFKYHTVKKEQR